MRMMVLAFLFLFSVPAFSGNHLVHLTCRDTGGNVLHSGNGLAFVHAVPELNARRHQYSAVIAEIAVRPRDMESLPADLQSRFSGCSQVYSFLNGRVHAQRVPGSFGDLFTGGSVTRPRSCIGQVQGLRDRGALESPSDNDLIALLKQHHSDPYARVANRCFYFGEFNRAPLPDNLEAIPQWQILGLPKPEATAPEVETGSLPVDP